MTDLNIKSVFRAEVTFEEFISFLIMWLKTVGTVWAQAKNGGVL